ncbi:hypothetical protein M422DRAFT_49311 [Sphaerobolus stellatus SS14]|uniref:Uncharacterized protein n=1 Tax=Sphaerobolus stellatus (strain SS14) TaxID=990650 RepID=A0A0C9VPS3_SPHS4|nr:hypothetical protein M422DRAFT_49311 [Sphaerobolus stellatus SS14]
MSRIQYMEQPPVAGGSEPENTLHVHNLPRSFSAPELGHALPQQWQHVQWQSWPNYYQHPLSNFNPPYLSNNHHGYYAYAPPYYHYGFAYSAPFHQPATIQVQPYQHAYPLYGYLPHRNTSHFYYPANSILPPAPPPMPLFPSPISSAPQIMQQTAPILHFLMSQPHRVPKETEQSISSTVVTAISGRDVNSSQDQIRSTISDYILPKEDSPGRDRASNNPTVQTSLFEPDYNSSQTTQRFSSGPSTSNKPHDSSTASSDHYTSAQALQVMTGNGSDGAENPRHSEEKGVGGVNEPVWENLEVKETLGKGSAGIVQDIPERNGVVPTDLLQTMHKEIISRLDTIAVLLQECVLKGPERLPESKGILTSLLQTMHQDGITRSDTFKSILQERVLTEQRRHSSLLTAIFDSINVGLEHMGYTYESDTVDEDQVDITKEEEGKGSSHNDSPPAQGSSQEMTDTGSKDGAEEGRKSSDTADEEQDESVRDEMEDLRQLAKFAALRSRR